MPRPNSKKRICRIPVYTSFSCDDGKKHCCGGIRMSMEEYETVRSIDYMGMSQEECAAHMQASRTTVQALYRDARKKMARFLTEGTNLVIEGGEVSVCGNGQCSGIKDISCQYNKKGDGGNMKLAVTYEAATEEIFQHFGHTETFKVYEIEDGEIKSAQVLGTGGTGHGALAGLLSVEGVSTLICGGIGGGARNALAEAGIEVYPGAFGNADENVKSFLAGQLAYDPNTMCSHHGEGHTCGSHTDGSCGHHEGTNCGSC